MRGEGQHPSWTTLGPIRTFPMATNAAHFLEGGVLGKVVQWSLHHGSVTMSYYCRVAVTT